MTAGSTTGGRKRSRLVLDPRTKLLMLIAVTTLMFSTGNEGIMNIVKPVLSLVPFALILTEKQYKTAVKYIVLYAVCFAAERLAMSVISGLPSFLLMAVCAIMTRFAPGIMMAAYLVASTSISEFIASMEKMHVTEKIVIPLSVIFRFIPAIKEEYHAINDAMRMRGIRLGGRNPLMMVEYRLVPLMVTVVKTGDELAAAALTRGLGAPVKRTNICETGFHVADVIAAVLCIACFAAFFFQRFC